MLVNQILLVSDVPRQHISPKHIGQLYVPCQGEQHSLFFDSQERAVCHCASRGRAGRLTSDGIFANKIAITQYVEDCFLPSLGLNAESYFSFLNDKQSIGRITLSIDCLSFSEGHHLPTNAPTVVRKVFGLKARPCRTIGLAVPHTQATLHFSIRTDDSYVQYCTQLSRTALRRHCRR